MSSTVRCVSVRSPSKRLFTSITSGTRPAMRPRTVASVGMRSCVPLIAIPVRSAARRSRTGPRSGVSRSRVKSWNTTASPSAVSCTSHSIAYPAAMAASAADKVFSTMPAARSCRPRCAIGRATSQGSAFMDARSSHLEHGLDLDGRVERQFGDPYGRAGVLAPLAEHGDNEIGGSVHHRRQRREGRDGVDEAPETHAAHDVVPVADSALEQGKDVDGAQPRGRLTGLYRDLGPELARVGVAERAVRPKAKLPR